MINRSIALARTITAKEAAEFVELCAGFESEVYIQKPELKINAKSLMGVISIALKAGQEVVVIASGGDEGDALESAAAYLTEM